MRWEALLLEFADESEVAEGRPHFYSYTYGLDGEIGLPPEGLTTDRGIGIESTVAELEAAYPGVLLNPEDEFISANFFVDEDLRGLLTGLEANDVVTLIAGGRSCRE